MQLCTTVPPHSLTNLPDPPRLRAMQGKQHYLLYCLTPAMKPRMLMTGAPACCCTVGTWFASADADALPTLMQHVACCFWLRTLCTNAMCRCMPCHHAAHMHTLHLNAPMRCCTLCGGRAGMLPQIGRDLILSATGCAALLSARLLPALCGAGGRLGLGLGSRHMLRQRF